MKRSMRMSIFLSFLLTLVVACSVNAAEAPPPHDAAAPRNIPCTENNEPGTGEMRRDPPDDEKRFADCLNNLSAVDKQAFVNAMLEDVSSTIHRAETDRIDQFRKRVQRAPAKTKAAAGGLILLGLLLLLLLTVIAMVGLAWLLEISAKRVGFATIANGLTKARISLWRRLAPPGNGA